MAKERELGGRTSHVYVFQTTLWQRFLSGYATDSDELPDGR